MSGQAEIWLALETSDRRAGFCVAHDGKVFEGRLEEGQSQSAHMIQVLKDTLLKLRIEPGSVTDLTLHVGPGSATGLRMGVALAQGWNLVHPEVRIHAIPLEACAREALMEWRPEGEVQKAVLLSDAFGGEVFLQHIVFENRGWELLGEMGRHPRAVIESLEGPLLVLEDLGNWKEKMSWPEKVIRYEERFPSARQVLAASKSGQNQQPIEKIDVRYLKPSSAELLWERRQKEG